MAVVRVIRPANAITFASSPSGLVNVQRDGMRRSAYLPRCNCTTYNENGGEGVPSRLKLIFLSDALYCG